MIRRPRSPRLEDQPLDIPNRSTQRVTRSVARKAIEDVDNHEEEEEEEEEEKEEEEEEEAKRQSHKARKAQNQRNYYHK
jgi:hypothetical protein